MKFFLNLHLKRSKGVSQRVSEAILPMIMSSPLATHCSCLRTVRDIGAQRGWFTLWYLNLP